MGTREARFYDELAPSIDMRIPASYFARSGDDGAFLMLLEDLQAIGASMSDGTWGIPADLAAGALSDLARLHVSFEAADRLAAIRPWVMATPATSSDYTKPPLRHVIDENADVLSQAYIAVAEMDLADSDAMIALWADGPQTLIHTRRSLGGTEISAGEAWQAHRVHTAYTVLASFLSLVPPYNGEDQREFSDAFRNRAITVLDDLETVPALKSLLA